jgi:hypothetical protein
MPRRAGKLAQEVGERNRARHPKAAAMMPRSLLIHRYAERVGSGLGCDLRPITKIGRPAGLACHDPLLEGIDPGLSRLGRTEAADGRGRNLRNFDFNRKIIIVPLKNTERRLRITIFDIHPNYMMRTAHPRKGYKFIFMILAIIFFKTSPISARFFYILEILSIVC